MFPKRVRITEMITGLWAATVVLVEDGGKRANIRTRASAQYSVK